MIDYNRDYKLPKETGFCRNKIIIGTDGCGNDSCISMLNDDKRVFFIDHETAEVDEETGDFRWEDEQMKKFESLEEYVKYQIEIYKSLD